MRGFSLCNDGEVYLHRKKMSPTAILFKELIVTLQLNLKKDEDGND